MDDLLALGHMRSNVPRMIWCILLVDRQRQLRWSFEGSYHVQHSLQNRPKLRRHWRLQLAQWLLLDWRDPEKSLFTRRFTHMCVSLGRRLRWSKFHLRITYLITLLAKNGSDKNQTEFHFNFIWLFIRKRLGFESFFNSWTFHALNHSNSLRYYRLEDSTHPKGRRQRTSRH